MIAISSSAPTRLRGEEISMKSALELRPGGRAIRVRLPDEKLEKLVVAAGRGDQGAWEALVREFGGMIWAIARAHRLHAADAADVAQGTWLRLFENLERLSDPVRIGAWLATTARRECLRLLREKDRQILFSDDAPEHASAESPPDEALLVFERDQALWRSFARLRPSDQALLRLLMAEPRPSYEEISAALDMPIGSIGPTRQRALARLRAELDGQGTLDLMNV